MFRIQHSGDVSRFCKEEQVSIDKIMSGCFIVLMYSVQWQIFKNIEQAFVYSEDDCRLLEWHIDNVARMADQGCYKWLTVDRAPLRSK